jgi:hydroxylamine reductase
MFCYQCEQTARGEGCGKSGVCGKQPDEAALQDLLTKKLVGLAQASIKARGTGIDETAVGRFMAAALFDTLTNVDFDPPRTA